MVIINGLAHIVLLPVIAGIVLPTVTTDVAFGEHPLL
jgi:hypothetical protein